jgi:two-component system sensor histidine kinase KdpD
MSRREAATIEEQAGSTPVLRPHVRPGSKMSSMPGRSSDVRHLLTALAAVSAVALVYGRWLHVSNPATVSTTYLLVVLLVATRSRFWIAAVTSLAAMLCFNYFFLPPVGTLTIADPHNWIALFVFLAVSLVASNLSTVARTRTREAVGRRDELARLFDLSRDVLLVTESREALAVLARSVARRFDLSYVAIALPPPPGWTVFEGGSGSVALDQRELADAFSAAGKTLEFDAHARTYAGHRTTTSSDGTLVRLVPLRVGTKPVGILAASGRPVEAGTLDALAGVVAIAIERVQFLEERKGAELTRHSEQLKTALLASLAHDLRTPLTAIRIAASNVGGSWLSEEERAEQGDIILAEVERLTRLFQNVIEMARIDAGAVAADARWTYPSEIVAAARDQVEQSLRRHRLELRIDDDLAVRLDPRLVAAALAQLLQNASQYAPPGTAVLLDAGVADGALTVRVRDHGPGLMPADVPHLFERFRRGTAAGTGTSGTGMGLWIARGLLAAQQGRIWAENAPDGGAVFTVVVPAATRKSAEVLPAS